MLCTRVDVDVDSFMRLRARLEKAALQSYESRHGRLEAELDVECC